MTKNILTRNILSALLFSLLLCLPVPQTATAGGCYSAHEFEAEQGIRIHSELMVIGLTCLKMPSGHGLYAKYQQFTRKHQSLISGYEEQMIGFFRKQGASAPEKQLHTLRTNLANEISQHAITMSTSNFCKHFGGRIDKALAMDQQKLRKWAQHVWPQSPTTVPVCR